MIYRKTIDYLRIIENSLKTNKNNKIGDQSEFEGDGQMNDLLTALHLEIVIVDLRVKMLEAIESGYYDLAMTMHFLLLVRIDELDAYKFAMPEKQWAIYDKMHP